jgi:hypothetical protein
MIAKLKAKIVYVKVLFFFVFFFFSHYFVIFVFSSVRKKVGIFERLVTLFKSKRNPCAPTVIEIGSHEIANQKTKQLKNN